jgi:hypothetical protein
VEKKVTEKVEEKAQEAVGVEAREERKTATAEVEARSEGEGVPEEESQETTEMKS